jgi:hypothetical protein
MGIQPSSGPLQKVRQHLEVARDALNAEIRDYPTPVSGCDAQYNHLLAERRRVRDAMRALDSDIHIPTPRAP